MTEDRDDWTVQIGPVTLRFLPGWYILPAAAAGICFWASVLKWSLGL